MNKTELFNKLKGGLIVSCQALPNEPLYQSEGGIMKLMAKAAENAGAKGIRAQGVVDIKQIKEYVDLPVIGIIKKEYPNFEQFITVTMDEIDALMAVGSDIIALDCTLRPRGDQKTLEQFITEIKTKYPNIVLMADIATLEEAIYAEKIGIDCVGTTLNGYTSYTKAITEFDAELVRKIVENVSIPVIAEGKIHTPQQAKLALECGAHCVVVGGAITRPQEIATRFIKEIQ